MYEITRRTGFVLIVVIVATLGVKCEGDFKSVPTVVRALQNDTVMLPCYLRTGSVEGK